MEKNPQEIDFQIGGKTYTYMLGSYALSKLEERMGGDKPWPVILQEGMSGWSIKLWLACFHCGLLLHHEPISEKEASVLLDQLTVSEFARRFAEVLKKQFPEAAAEDSGRPPVAAAASGNGIGIPSSATG